jgi:hypothetical protein
LFDDADINKRIEDGVILSDKQYNDASDDLKLKYIKICTVKEIGLTNQQYKDTPEMLKLEYINLLTRGFVYQVNINDSSDKFRNILKKT